MDAANCSSRPCSPDVYTVRVHARVRAIRMYRSIDVRRHLLSQSCLQRVAKTPVTDFTGKTQPVLSPSTVKRFRETNKLPHKEAHHAALPLTCPLCERETSQTVFINKTSGGLVCPPCKVHGELTGGLSCPMHCSESVIGQGCCGRGGAVLQDVSA